LSLPGTPPRSAGVTRAHRVPEAMQPSYPPHAQHLTGTSAVQERPAVWDTVLWWPQGQAVLEQPCLKYRVPRATAHARRGRQGGSWGTGRVRACEHGIPRTPRVVMVSKYGGIQRPLEETLSTAELGSIVNDTAWPTGADWVAEGGVRRAAGGGGQSRGERWGRWAAKTGCRASTKGGR
jgi:hypothetical protein